MNNKQFWELLYFRKRMLAVSNSIDKIKTSMVSTTIQDHITRLSELNKIWQHLGGQHYES